MALAGGYGSMTDQWNRAANPPVYFSNAAPNRDPDRVRGDAGQSYMPPPAPPTAEQIAAEQQRQGIVSAWNAGNTLLGYNNARYNQQRGEYGSDYQNALDLLNWQRGGLANELTNAQQNLGMRDEIIANLQRMYGINDRELANKIAQSWLDQSVQSAVLNQQTGLNALQGLQRTQANRSAGISSGMGFFPGYGVGGQQIAEETNRNADILANRLRGVVEGGDLTRAGLNIGKEATDIGLANQILGQRQTRLGDQATLFNTERAGGRYSLEEQKLLNQYNQNLNQLGFNQGQAPLEMIYKLLSSNDANQQALGRMIAEAQGVKV